MEIKINGKKYKTKKDEVIFEVCRRNGIKIPTLCSTEKIQEGNCRICLVETNEKLITSCNTKVCAGMEIETDSQNVQKARRINLELLWADHAGKCATCKKNRMCKLQELAEFYKIENFHFIPRKGEITGQEELDLIRDNWTRVAVENENPCIARDSQFCVECKRCINVCPEKKFGFNHRGSRIIVGTEYESVLNCSFCGECVAVCPVAALTDKNDYQKIIADLDDLKKFSVAVLDFQMEEKILKLAEKISPEKKLDQLFFDLGFEKIIKLSEVEKDREDEIIKNIKTEYARQEKINTEDIRVFFISSKIYRKIKKGKYLDYVLSEREVARLLRDREKIKEGKMRL